MVVVDLSQFPECDWAFKIETCFLPSDTKLVLGKKPQLGAHERGSRNKTLLRRVPRFFSRKCFSEGFLELVF